jgi:ribosomal protein L24
MAKRQKLHVKIGDNVKVISGFDKNKTGEVVKIYRNRKNSC